MAKHTNPQANRRRKFHLGLADPTRVPTMDDLLDFSLEVDLRVAREKIDATGDAVAIFATDIA